MDETEPSDSVSTGSGGHISVGRGGHIVLVSGSEGGVGGGVAIFFFSFIITVFAGSATATVVLHVLILCPSCWHLPHFTILD